MSQGTCAVIENGGPCGKVEQLRRGMCQMHYQRWKKWGDPLGAPLPESLPGETWRAVPGYEGIYDVSSMARVRSLPRPTTPGGILKPSLNPQGYQVVKLCKGGEEVARTVHGLVALAFHGPRGELEVRHLDGDQLNNLPGNLTYGTHAENMQDMVRHGRGNAGVTHCGKCGMPLDEANTYVRPGVTGRNCRNCRRLDNHARYLAQKQVDADCPTTGSSQLTF
jgi:hypothetical protein